ncbi:MULTISPECIES: hypothetical protein [Dyella]|uniref:DUF1579 domain-containing protein n=2 Tax=Dyella TaxID=231454 RepID=A0A4R0Z0N0_9GAMM|nr:MULTISPECIES: hypothetical protein [Dyella]TBR39487.1 hypothetical protein EYV96_04545 [Dyella terrae]TCI12928.1 hypothetical protein EZM97_06325 [Dyella soli]
MFTKPQAALAIFLCAACATLAPRTTLAENPRQDAAAAFEKPARDGSHDFDFLIGDWKAHVRRLPDRLNHSTVWNEYDGISNHHKLIDTNANFEQFDVTSPDKKLHIRAQTLRMYNPDTHQWSIYGLDLDKGELQAPVVGQFHGDRGEFYNQQTWNGRIVLVRWMWHNISPTSARMEQSFSPDGGKSWEVNWICELSR